MAEIHNSKKRMPLILGRGEEKNWIEPDLSETAIKSLLKPFNADEMEAHTISKLITQRGVDNNVTEVMEQFPYPKLEVRM